MGQIRVGSGWLAGFGRAMAIALVAFAALYLRTLPIHQEWSPDSGKIKRRIAEQMIRQAVSEQVQQGSALALDPIPDNLRAAWIREKVDELVRKDPAQFEAAVSALVRTMPVLASGESRRFLLEADPYLYYHLTDNIRRTGRMAPLIEGGRYYNPLRAAPFGFWSVMNVHPYLGYVWYRVIALLDPAVDLMDCCYYFPVFLTLLTVLSFWFFCRSAGFGNFSFVLSGMTLVTAPIFFQRSLLGWYDTDPYNLIFPFLVCGIFLRVLSGSRFSWRGVSLMAAMTAAFAFLWLGWPFLFVLILAAGIVLGGLESLRGGKFPVRDAFRYLLVYFLMTVGILLVTMTPRTLITSVIENSGFLSRFAATQPDLWPDLFMTVGETRSISFKKLVYLTGTPISYAVALVGVAGIFVVWLRKGPKDLIPVWILAAVMFFPLYYLARQTERFGLIYLIPLTYFTAMGSEMMARASSSLAARYVPFRLLRLLGKGFLVLIVFAVVLPVPIILAGQKAMKERAIMNNAWYEALVGIREKTPPNAILHSWWPPGYFFIAVAERRTFLDGGTQQLPEAYWMARFFMSFSEREAFGILRMLNISGNRSVDFLIGKGLVLPDAIEMINSILPLARAEAERYLEAYWNAEIRKQLLDLTHGSVSAAKPPGYVFVYNEMIEQNLGISLVARWNFRAAWEAAGAARVSEKESVIDPRTRHIHRNIELSDGILRYRSEAGLDRREGDTLHFKNGLSVDLKTFASNLRLESENIDGPPMSLFFMDNGRLREIVNQNMKVDVSALIYEYHGEYFSVLADRRLIASLLFRLYYLQGEGLSLCRPFLMTGKGEKGTRIQIYEVNWNAFNGSLQ